MHSGRTAYRHSGTIGPTMFMVSIGGIKGAIILSFIYAYIEKQATAHES